MLYICPTYDYELFFGKSIYSDYEVLIEPTYRLLELYKQLGINFTLFADVCCFLKCKQVNPTFYNEVVKQLQIAVSENNDVQLHLHPHWCNASFVNGKWEFKSDEYRIHSFSKEMQKRIVLSGIQFLADIIKPVKNEYKVTSFRAGGYCLQPESSFTTILYENGIRIDSSVLSGGYKKNSSHYYDYRKNFNHTSYFFDYRKGTLFTQNSSNNAMLEIPIGTVSSFIKKLRIRSTLKKFDRPAIKGTFIDSKSSSFIDKVFRKITNFSNNPYLLEFDEWNSRSMMIILDSILKKIDFINNDIYLSVVGHPKVSCKELLDNTRIFYEMLFEKYSNDVKVVSFSEVLEKFGTKLNL